MEQTERLLDRQVAEGIALAARGDLAAGLAMLHDVATRRPDEPHPCLDLIPHLRAAGRAADIERMLRAVLAARPGSPLVAFELARHCRKAGKPREALPFAELAARSNPDWPEVRRLLGWIYADLGDLEASAEYSREALRLDPRDAAAWSNLGVALTDLGQHAEGEQAHRQALSLAEREPRIRVNAAVNLLAQGKYAEAWPDYEWRLRLPGHTLLPEDKLLPDLGAGPCLAGKTILVTHEEGLGDTIQFARYLPLLAARGADVLAHAPPALERLFSNFGPGVEILPNSAPMPRFDYHCPYTSLPRAFGTTLSSIPTSPYLAANLGPATHWHFELAPLKRPLIGLVWAGQARPWLEGYGPLDGRRSMRLADLAPLLGIPGASWISLQKGSAAEEAREFARIIFDPMPYVTDFADTAAIIANLDAVVSVDTSVAHLAGAMGKPVFLLDRFDTCWRWLRNRSDSPWYPSLTIFRQERIGEWEEPIQEVQERIRTFFVGSMGKMGG